jgi:hypothetical protein
VSRTARSGATLAAVRRRLIATAVTVAAVMGAGAASAHAYVFAPYVDVTQFPTPHLAALAGRAHLHQETLAFVVASAATPGACAATWGGQPTEPASGPKAFDVAGISALAHRPATSLAISFGGEDGTELASACPTAAALEQAYEGVIETYHPRRLDFDIEGAAVGDTQAIARRSAALAFLQHQAAAAGHPFAVSLTLPVLPSGLSASGLAIVRSALRHHLKLASVNVMAMDYGESAAPRPAGRMATFAIRAATGTIAQLHRLSPGLSLRARERMLGITSMIGVNDDPHEIFTLADARHLARWARGHHIGLISMWQLERDRACAAPTSTTQIACSSLQQTPFAFSRALGR